MRLDAFSSSVQWCAQVESMLSFLFSKKSFAITLKSLIVNSVLGRSYSYISNKVSKINKGRFPPKPQQPILVEMFVHEQNSKALNTLRPPWMHGLLPILVSFAQVHRPQ